MFMGFIFCLLDCTCLTKASKILALSASRSIQQDVINVMDQHDVLWNVRVIRDLVDNIVTKSKRVDIALGQDIEGICCSYKLLLLIASAIDIKEKAFVKP